MVEIECEIASKSDMVAKKLYIFQDEYLANFLSFEKFYHKKSKIPTKMNFPKMSFLHEFAKIEIFMVMCPSIFFPTPLPPGHLRVQSRGGLVQFRGWYPEAITRAIPWVLPGGRMGNQKIE